MKAGMVSLVTSIIVPLYPPRGAYQALQLGHSFVMNDQSTWKIIPRTPCAALTQVRNYFGQRMFPHLRSIPAEANIGHVCDRRQNHRPLFGPRKPESLTR